MENNEETGNKTERTVGGHPPFDSNNQPSRDAKKKGWDRKRQAKTIMDLILNYQNMNLADLKNMYENGKDKLTVLEVTMMKYVLEGMRDKKMMIDMIDRHVPKAPQTMQMTGGDEDSDGGNIIIEVIGGQK